MLVGNKIDLGSKYEMRHSEEKSVTTRVLPLRHNTT